MTHSVLLLPSSMLPDAFLHPYTLFAEATSVSGLFSSTCFPFLAFFRLQFHFQKQKFSHSGIILQLHSDTCNVQHH